MIQSWTDTLLRDSNLIGVTVCVGTVLLLARKGLARQNWLLIGMLGVQALTATIDTSILFYRSQLDLSRYAAYHLLFYSHWILFACEAVLQVAIIYKVFNEYLQPLQGLQYIGKIIFRWVAAVSILVSLAFAIGPHAGVAAFGFAAFVSTVITQIQQGVGVLTLCLLLFVTFSAKPLGLTYRSRGFGVICGLGVLSCTTLIQAAWTAH